MQEAAYTTIVTKLDKDRCIYVHVGIVNARLPYTNVLAWIKIFSYLVLWLVPRACVKISPSTPSPPNILLQKFFSKRADTLKAHTQKFCLKHAHIQELWHKILLKSLRIISFQASQYTKQEEKIVQKPENRATQFKNASK